MHWCVYDNCFCNIDSDSKAIATVNYMTKRIKYNIDEWDYVTSYHVPYIKHLLAVSGPFSKQKIEGWLVQMLGMNQLADVGHEMHGGMT